MSKKRVQGPIKIIKLPKAHFEKILAKAKRNEEFWKKLATVADDEIAEVNLTEEE